MRFAKGHGTGNDFVILPDPDGTLPLTPALVAALCDRRRGIGADGVLRVVRSAAHPDAEASSAGAEWFMDYWNADGSQSEMCGNGVRVYARYLAEAGLVAPEGTFDLVTRGGVVPVTMGEEIAAAMPIPRVYVSSSATVLGQSFTGTAVDVGNPHLVCAVDEPTLEGLELLRAPVIDPLIFPAGVNVEFAAVGPAPAGTDLYRRMRVYERGSGETQSCGSGACAVAAVAVHHAGLESGVVVVDVPGGRLTVTVTPNECVLQGPAVIVAHGDVDAQAIRQLVFS
ncbi:diaminopimelate epimerase [Dactylosporangium matsuzakiense]|uniref:Diaminopimelate epimerase n=1 Tax=Dactylosporangium matsuzakiense TaxID=53360 RepID=A0A9W6KW51_9ACTN|nr:diaminopimelate epimerase [Dactylosporangium matsuzakiense]UWZ46441.1 diaminopimelate epimerase [Dactylosporangium matsuzakiense]GLL06564.1 diaminopimelate epimerase [Dactylosporangium matsuzakiense]